MTKTVEERRFRQKLYRVANDDAIRAQQKAWKDANKERISKVGAKYWEEHKEEISEKRKAKRRLDT